MARETKTQRIERERIEQQEMFDSLVAGYHDRLMHNLERASKLGITIKVKDGNFIVSIWKSWDCDTIVLCSSSRNFTSFYDANNMEIFESELDTREFEESERERLAQIKVDALAKLTKEEKEVLGIK